MARDYSREAAHRRYEQAYGTADAAGAITQAAVNNAYLNLLQNTEWTPEEDWAEQYQEGPEAYRPASYLESGWAQTDYGTPYSASSYSVAPEEESRIPDPVTMGLEEDDDLKSQSGYEDQQDQDQQQHETSSLFPMIEKIGSMGQQVDQMSANDRFELAKKNFQEDAEEDKARTTDAARQIAENQLISQFASMGSNPYDDELFNRNVDTVRNSNYKDLENLVNESSRRLPELNLLGFTSQKRSDDATRNLYDIGFQMEDESLRNDPFWTGLRRGSWGNWDDGQESAAAPVAVNLGWGSMGFDPNNDPLYQQQMESAREIPMEAVVGDSAIDDGIHPEARESIYMTGPRYIDYVQNYGIPGRPVSEIDPDPNTIYNKQDEMDKYGFVPYLVSDEGISKFHDDASMNAVNNVFNSFADLRRDNTSYSFNYDGHTYDGKDVVNKYPAWKDRVMNSNEKPFTDPSMVTEDSVPLTWYIVDDVTGETVYAPSPNGEFKEDPETGQPMIDFHTGNPDDNWYFKDYEEINSKDGGVKYEFAGDSHPTYAWRNLEPLKLSDGQKIRADKAMDLYDNQDNYANYGFLNWGKPSVNDPIAEGGGWAPWFVDMALGSAPLFWGPTASTQAIGNAYQNMQGFKPGAQDDNGTYRLISEDPTRLQQLVTSSGSALLPATERLWGIGRTRMSNAMPGLNSLRNRFPNIAEHPVSVLLENALGEGVEEVPGNIVEEMQGSGSLLASDYFANPLYYYFDDDGNKVYTTLEANPNDPEEKYNPAYDKHGKRLADRNTNPVDRWNNFWEEAPLSMLGGALLGGALGSGEAVGAIGPYRESKEEREKWGYNMVVPEEVLNYTRRQQEGE